jgi:hypothetical protein
MLETAGEAERKASALSGWVFGTISATGSSVRRDFWSPSRDPCLQPQRVDEG